MYQPLRFFAALGGVLIAGGSLISMRFLYFFFTEGGGGHVQSLILAAVLLIVGFQIMLIGLVADLIAGSRRISEDVLYRVKQLELGLHARSHAGWIEDAVEAPEPTTRL
ncbi:hypothetical protein D3C72_1048280 [compost metagenome]